MTTEPSRLSQLVIAAMRDVHAATCRGERVTLTSGGEPLITFHPDSTVTEHKPIKPGELSA